MTPSKPLEIAHFHAIQSAPYCFADTPVKLEGLVTLANVFEPGFEDKVGEYLSLQVTDSEGTSLYLLLHDDLGSAQVLNKLAKSPAATIHRARFIARHNSKLSGTKRAFLGIVESFSWVEEVKKEIAVDNTDQTESTSPAGKSRRDLAKLGLALFGVAAASGAARTAKATPGTEDAALAAIAGDTAAIMKAVQDSVNFWNDLLGKMNKAISAAEKTRDFLQDFSTPDKNVLLVQARQLATYANTFFKRDSDFLKSRFMLFDLHSQVLYRQSTDTLAEFNYIYDEWKMLISKGKPELVSDETFRQSPKGSALVAGNHSTYNTHVSELQTANLASQNDRLLEEIASRPANSDADRSKLYSDLVQPLRTKAELEQLRLLAEISHSLNDIKYILLQTPVPNGSGRKPVTKADYDEALRQLRETGRVKKKDSKIAARTSGK